MTDEPEFVVKKWEPSEPLKEMLGMFLVTATVEIQNKTGAPEPVARATVAKWLKITGENIEKQLEKDPNFEIEARNPNDLN